MTLAILLASADAADAAWLRSSIGPAVPVVHAQTTTDVLARAAGASVIVVGDHVADGDAGAILDLISEGEVPVPVVRLGSPAHLSPDARVTFVLNRSMPAPAVAALVTSLAWGRPSAAVVATAERVLDADEAERRSRAYAVSRQLAVAPDLAAAERAGCAALLELVDADRVRCVFVDAGTGELWSGETSWRADRGVVAWCARTGAAACLERAASDARWCDRDDPQAHPNDRVLVQPVLGDDREVHAVLIAVRGGRRPAFAASDVAAVRALAEQAGPLLQQLARHVEARAVLEQARDARLFRHEATQAQAEDRWGEVLRVTPGWVRWVYAGLVVSLLAGAGFLVFGRIRTYSRGVGVVRLLARHEITVPSAGNVADLDVAVGDRVVVGQVVLRLDDTDQAAELARLERAFHDRLRQRLLMPTDGAASEAVALARVELERGRDALETRRIHASRPGIIGDLRVRPGQRLAPGDVVASIVDPDAGAELVAMVPGGDRPRIAAGQRVRLELHGFRHAYQDLLITSVASEVMGSDEAQRYLGRAAGDLGLSGPVVLVRARLPRVLLDDDASYAWVDGMGGTVHIEVESERIVHALIPGLERW